MGFFDALSKMAQGKPVYGDQSEPTAAASVPVVNSGRKVIPQVALSHDKTHFNGNSIMVTVVVTNRSEVEIELDYINMIGQKTRLDRRLQPGEGHEARVYNGPVPTNDSAHRANLVYKTVQGGDYFQANFQIEYNRESNGTFSVEDFHPDGPVRDI